MNRRRQEFEAPWSECSVFIGTLGILFATLIGGQLFDKLYYAAPFTMMAAVNAIIAIWALFLRLNGAVSADSKDPG